MGLQSQTTVDEKKRQEKAVAETKLTLSFLQFENTLWVDRDHLPPPLDYYVKEDLEWMTSIVEKVVLLTPFYEVDKEKEKEIVRDHCTWMFNKLLSHAWERSPPEKVVTNLAHETYMPQTELDAYWIKHKDRLAVRNLEDKWKFDSFVFGTIDDLRGLVIAAQVVYRV